MKHKWKSQRLGGNPTEYAFYEWVTYCDECGIELDEDNEDEECPPYTEEESE